MSRAEHDRLANAIRALAMDAVEQAKSGHPGLPMGAADIATVLFTQFLKYDIADPKWPDRDRFILSAGHGSMLIYSVLHLLGSEAVTIDQLKNFRKLGSITAGHPENFVTPGVETTTGPLGQGIGNAVGMAIAERHLNAEFGNDIVDHHTYVLCSDGDLMEGISQEAIALAGHLKLNKLIVLFDDNGISIDGALSLADSVDQVKRFEAAGWSASRIDGHDPQQIAAVQPGETAQVTAIVKPAAESVAGDYSLTLRASAGSASQSVDMRYTLKGSTTLGVVAIAVIVAALAALAGVFVKFGRR
jgi:transketolase